jgi:hypothetical protein
MRATSGLACPPQRSLRTSLSSSLPFLLHLVLRIHIPTPFHLTVQHIIMFSKALVLAALLPYAFGAATYTVTVGIDETDGKAGLGFDPTSIRPSSTFRSCLFHQ